MKLKTLLIINAIIATVYGIAFVLVPAQVLSMYDLTVNATSTYISQLSGASLLGYAVLTWLARNVPDSDARRAIVLAAFVSDAVAFVVALIGQLAGVANSLGWVLVASCLLLAFGFGYFHFTRSASP
jgi:hypothetical protein